ncbi:MAG TPA: ATP-binding protein [Tepidisphaeraceae bacterium]|nr:ATP-binding protein [Tepidisphaeraceae bacterium]
MSILHLFTRDQVLLSKNDMAWMWATVVLSLVVLAGYVAIGFNWYFQSRLARKESAAALRHLRNIFLICAVCGYAFWTIDLPWVVWRSYNVLLFGLACYTWSYVWRSRGVSLIDELEQVANRYRDIAELLPYIVWTATENGKVDYVNQRWGQFSDSQTWLDAVHPDEQEEVAAWWEKILHEREPAGREIRLAARGGGHHTFIVKATPIVNGHMVKWLGACADIEDQKRLAEEKENQARQKSFFLNALSHDLRAPLNNVVLNAHLLKMSPSEPADPEAVDMIIENAIAAGELLSRLLEYARAGHEHNSADTVAINALLLKIGRRFLPPARQKGLTLQVAEAPELTCITDRNKLERILTNLVDNAVKHTEAGAVELSAIPAEAEGIVIRISDTGKGIASDAVPFLFDEFYQVNNHERDRSKGFGLGLAICRSLARQLGGDVRLAATGSQGSCFEVLLQSNRAGGRGRPQRAAGDRPHPATSGIYPGRSGNREGGNVAARGPAQTPVDSAGLDVAGWLGN